ncbi:MAG: Smr/MutS family protein [Desulfobacula sp.]|nr:Smr/MutS family protein [Desulfobacula sp.]
MSKSKKNKTHSKNDLPVFDSDEVFMDAFINKDVPKTDTKKQKDGNNLAKQQDCEDSDDSLEHEDFATMLEKSFKTQQVKPLKKSNPMPLKKRLKRYPKVELELDLHGYNAIGAQLKLRSFIQTCKHQGFFTVRIIVGKGLHSEDGAVLPDIVEDELKEMKKQNLVIFYKWDGKKKIKSGAIIVYLKQFEQYE